jgi:hypothetical protein
LVVNFFNFFLITCTTVLIKQRFKLQLTFTSEASNQSKRSFAGHLPGQSNNSSRYFNYNGTLAARNRLTSDPINFVSGTNKKTWAFSGVFLDTVINAGLTVIYDLVVH